VRVPGLKKMRLTARWLKSRLARRAVILGYHRVAQEPNDPFGLCVAPQHFRDHLEVIRSFGRAVSLQQLVQGVSDGGVPQRAIAVTFDDGYADVLGRAKSLLDQYEIPATVFIVSGYLGREFWWDALERLLRTATVLPQRLQLSLGPEPFTWPASGAAPGRRSKGWRRGDSRDAAAAENVAVDLQADSRRRLLSVLYHRLRALSDEQRRNALEDLSAQLGVRPEEPTARRALDPEELIRLAEGGLVEVGAHTVTHPVLPDLSPTGQRAEIVQSKSALERLLDRPVSMFSYPYGRFSPATAGLVREAGFACACTSTGDVAWRGSNRFELPRFWVPNWDGERFSRWLRRWLGA